MRSLHRSRAESGGWPLLVLIACLLFSAAAHADWTDDTARIQQLVRSGEYAAAEQVATESLNRGPGGFLFSGMGTLTIHYWRGRLRLLLGNNAGAIEDADALIKGATALVPADMGYSLRAVARGQGGDASGAMSDFEAALSIARSGRMSGLRSYGLIAERAVVKLLLNDVAGAEEDLSQALAGKQDAMLMGDYIAARRESWTSLRAAIEKLRAGDAPGATELAQKAVAILRDSKGTAGTAEFVTTSLFVAQLARQGGAAVAPVSVAAAQDPSGGRVGRRLQGMRERNADGAGGARRNGILNQLLVPANYQPSPSVSKRMSEINDLKFAYIDKTTGYVMFVGAYDPAYASGPIPYNSLLSDAVENQYPRFTLEIPNSGGQSPLGKIRSTLDQEFARIARDPKYGEQWLGRMILPILKGESADPDQQAALIARLQVLDIKPASYLAYMKWQLSGFEDMQAYNQGAVDFLPRLFELSGLSRKGGAEVTAYRVYATSASRDSLEQWCHIAGYSELLARVDQDVRNGGDRAAGRKKLLPALYGSMLRGLGMSDSEVRRIQSDYDSQGGNEAVLLSPLEQRYQALFQRFLIDKLVNGMSFTGATLSSQYDLPTIMSPLNTYGARRDSPVMNVFFQADYILKFLTSSPRPGERVPQHRSSQQYLGDAENRAGQSAGRLPSSGTIRYWLYPQQVTLEALEGNAGVHFEDASVRVGVEMLDSAGGDSAGMQFYKATLDQYSTHLTSLYDQYARLYPMLHTLRETEKVVALARWAKLNGVHLRVTADETAPASLPDTAPGFWGMTYIVRPAGATDTIVTWAQGGVDFGQSAGGTWMRFGPTDRQVTTDALRSLAASTALAEKAATAALGGDLEASRDLAERSAQAMSGNIDFTKLPPVPMPSARVPDPASVAAVSQASIVAVELNTQGLQQARQGLAQADSLQAADPVQAAQIRQQSQQLQDRSMQDLNRVQTMLQEYRGKGSNGFQVAVDLRGLDPNKPATVEMPRPAAPKPAPAAPRPAADPCPEGLGAVLPTRQQVLSELTSRRLELENLRNTLVRLNRNIQLDQREFADWQAEAEDAVQRLTERKQDLYRDAGFGLMTYGIEKWMLYDKITFGKLAPADRVRVKRKVEILEGAKDAKEFASWALSNKQDWEMIEGGVRSILESLSDDARYQAVVKGTEAIIDNIYDAADFQVTWESLNRLNRSSDQYLQVVKQNGERMKALVTRIRDLESQLRQAPRQPPGNSPCKPAELDAEALALPRS